MWPFLRSAPLTFKAQRVGNGVEDKDLPGRHCHDEVKNQSPLCNRARSHSRRSGKATDPVTGAFH